MRLLVAGSSGQGEINVMIGQVVKGCVAWTLLRNESIKDTFRHKSSDKGTISMARMRLLVVAKYGCESCDL